MISVLYRSHLFFVPLRPMVIVFKDIGINDYFKFFKTFFSRHFKFILEMSKERFSRSIVETISFPTHRLLYLEFCEFVLVFWMSIMPALIRMKKNIFTLLLSQLFFQLFYGMKSCFQSKIPTELMTYHFSCNHISHH